MKERTARNSENTNCKERRKCLIAVTMWRRTAARHQVDREADHVRGFSRCCFCAMVVFVFTTNTCSLDQKQELLGKKKKTTLVARFRGVSEKKMSETN